MRNLRLVDKFNLISFFLACLAVTRLQAGEVSATNCLISMGFFLLTFILSKFGKLDKASIDFDDRKIELDGADEPEKAAK